MRVNLKCDLHICLFLLRLFFLPITGRNYWDNPHKNDFLSGKFVILFENTVVHLQHTDTKTPAARKVKISARQHDAACDLSKRAQCFIASSQTRKIR